MKHKNIGDSFDSFLEDEEILEQVEEATKLKMDNVYTHYYGDKMKEKITNIDQLKKLAKVDGGMDCYIQLNYGAKSSKHISFIVDENIFKVTNEIDGSIQIMTPNQILDEKHTLLGKAMRLGALILY